MTNDPFLNALAQLDKAGQIMNLEKKYWEILKFPDRVMKVSIPVTMDNGETKVFVGYRAQYNNALGPYKGGIRYHWQVTEEEVKALSFWMMIKCATVNIPMGGGKGGIIVNSKELSSGELERLSRGYVQKIWRYLGSDKDVPAPDMYTTPEIMGWMRDEYEKLIGQADPGVITGKAVAQGGSEGRETATAQGGVYVVRELAKKLGLIPEKTTVAVQGMGNVGGYMAKLLAQDGYRIVALSDSKGGVYNPERIEISKAEDIKRAGGLLGCYCLGMVCDLKQIPIDGPCQHVTNEQLLELPVDILVPAAMENQITQENAGRIKAKVIVEMANGPTTPEADEILKNQGKVLVPDVLANAGGVTVSYFEWEQNVKNERWSEAKVFAKLEPIMQKAFNEVWETKEKYQIDLRTAAFVKAIERVVLKMKEKT
ncbi:MAG TPA: Glu/Leu/Phe/Val dehydrogenase [Patescibacteria group bacterium]|nr:Glu/Leu/Phe/Val dehydrogenase [Patescibacteria group bacterium]